MLRLLQSDFAKLVNYADYENITPYNTDPKDL